VFDTSSAAFATKADVPVARAALKRSLKDPESARFSGEAFRPGAICGLVNSKNSYGGYVGDFAYLYVLATGEVYVLQSTGDHTEDGTVLAKFERYCQT
jgi:hypothetical protein